MTPATSGRVSERYDHNILAFRYWRGQVFPRWKGLLYDKSLWVSVVVAGFVTLVVGRLPAASLQIDDVAGSVMDYSAIGLGACITTLVLAIGLASEARIRTWSTTYLEGARYSAYSELVFVMTWAAITQLGATVVAWVSTGVGGNIDLMPDRPLLAHQIEFFGATTVVVYAFLHLFTVISTLSMIAAVTIHDAQTPTDAAPSAVIGDDAPRLRD